ncbi:MAG: hypothetical protein NQ127_03485 [Candidatus Cardinium sp.]|nr:hypothetical protein [Candidatus Cardinium sp.]
MQYSLKTVAKETLLYSLERFALRGCSSLITLWLQTTLLPPSAYGVITEFYGYVALGQVVYFLAMDMAYCRFAPTLGQQYTFNIVTTLLMLTGLLLSLTIGIVAPQIARITGHLKYIRYFYYVALLLPLDTLLYIVHTKLRTTHKISQLLLIKFIQVLANAGLSFILLYFPAGLAAIAHTISTYLSFITVQLNPEDAIFIANLLANILTLSFTLPYFKGFRWIWHSHTIQRMVHYATHALLTTLFLRLHDQLPLLLFRQLVPSVFCSRYTKEAIVGNLGMAYKLATCFALGIQAFKYAVEPFLFNHAKHNNSPKLYGQLMYLYLYIACLVLSLFSLNIKWIIKVFLPSAYSHHSIEEILPYLAFIYVCLGAFYNLTLPLKISNHTVYIVWITACGSFITAILLCLLIPRFGHWGCIYATMSSSIAMALSAYCIGQSYYPIPYYKKGFILLVLTFLVLASHPLWSEKLISLQPGFAYLFLNTITIGLFYAISKSLKKMLADQEVCLS